MYVSRSPVVLIFLPSVRLDQRKSYCVWLLVWLFTILWGTDIDIPCSPPTSIRVLARLKSSFQYYDRLIFSYFFLSLFFLCRFSKFTDVTRLANVAVCHFLFLLWDKLMCIFCVCWNHNTNNNSKKISSTKWGWNDFRNMVMVMVLTYWHYKIRFFWSMISDWMTARWWRTFRHMMLSPNIKYNRADGRDWERERKRDIESMLNARTCTSERSRNSLFDGRHIK